MGGDYSISSAFPLTPFKDATHAFQGFMPISARGVLNPSAFLEA